MGPLVVPFPIIWRMRELGSNGVTRVIVLAYVDKSYPAVGNGPLWHMVQCVEVIGWMSFTHVSPAGGGGGGGGAAVTVTVTCDWTEPAELLATSV